MQGLHRNLKEMLIRSKQENSELRAEVETLPRLKDRLRTLELQLKVNPCYLPYPPLCVPYTGSANPCYPICPCSPSITHTHAY